VPSHRLQQARAQRRCAGDACQITRTSDHCEVRSRVALRTRAKRILRRYRALRNSWTSELCGASACSKAAREGLLARIQKGCRCRSGQRSIALGAARGQTSARMPKIARRVGVAGRARIDAGCLPIGNDFTSSAVARKSGADQRYHRSSTCDLETLYAQCWSPH